MDDINDFLKAEGINVPKKPEPPKPKLPEKLDDGHKKRIDDLWDKSPEPPSLKELVDAAAELKNVDPRTKFGRAVREYLATKGRTNYRLEGIDPKPKPTLSEDNKEYIRNNCEMMSAAEMAREIFGDKNLNNNHTEVRIVAAYLKTIDFKKTWEDPNSVPLKDYRPPASLIHLASAVNRCVNPQPNIPTTDTKLISPKQKKELQMLGNYMRTFRFIHLANSFEKQEDRDLFESCFVRYTYDKPDLSEEEVDQYMSLCVDIVISASIQRRAERLRSLIDQAADANDVDKQKFSISLVDAIEKMQTEYHQCQNRMKALLSDLKGKRSERINKAINDNASILNLVQCWKDQELRQRMIRLAQLKKQKLEKEIDNLADMDELKARIFGLTRDEALNG